MSKTTPESKKADAEPNRYYSEKLFSSTLQILSVFPTWTNIIQNKCSSNWNLFTYLELKKIGQRHCYHMNFEIFKKHGTLEASAFVIDYAIFLREICRENRKSVEINSKGYIFLTYEEENSKKMSLMHSYFRHEDNWKGKIQKNYENYCEDHLENVTKDSFAIKDDTIDILPKDEESFLDNEDFETEKSQEEISSCKSNITHESSVSTITYTNAGFSNEEIIAVDSLLGKQF